MNQYEADTTKISEWIQFDPVTRLDLDPEMFTYKGSAFFLLFGLIFLCFYIYYNLKCKGFLCEVLKVSVFISILENKKWHHAISGCTRVYCSYCSVQFGRRQPRKTAS